LFVCSVDNSIRNDPNVLRLGVGDDLGMAHGNYGFFGLKVKIMGPINAFFHPGPVAGQQRRHVAPSGECVHSGSSAWVQPAFSLIISFMYLVSVLRDCDYRHMVDGITHFHNIHS